MPIVSSPYRAPRWLLNRHLETILPARLRKVQGVNYKRERFFTEDHDFIDLDWSVSGHNKLAILTYGAIASSQSSCILGMVKKLSLAGYDSVIWNFRGADQPNCLRRFYHGGNSDDLHQVIQHIRQNKPYHELILVGFSYGGNIVLKYLGEMGKALNKSIYRNNFKNREFSKEAAQILESGASEIVREQGASKDPKFWPKPTPPKTDSSDCFGITKAVTISVPCELGSSAKELAKLTNVLYSRDFIKKVTGRLQSKKKAFPEKFHDIDFDKIRNVIELDTKIATQLNDFISVDHYYRVCSSKQYIPNIAIPTLILNSQNDPLLSADNFPVRECENHQWVTLEMPYDGGHIGFMISSINGPYYSEERALDFIKG